MYKMIAHFIIALLLLPYLSGADVSKKSEGEVQLGAMGTMVTIEINKIKGLKMYSQSLTEFKGGTGMLGTVLQQMGTLSNKIRITDLEKKVIYILDMDKKTYQEIPIAQYKQKLKRATEMTSSRVSPRHPAYSEDSTTHKIIRNQFEVKKTGARKTINGFPAEQYSILWVMEILNTETNERTIDSLVGEIWTSTGGKLEEARKEEKEFYQAYMKAMDLEFNPMESKLLGLNYINFLMQTNGSQERKIDFDYRNLNKLKTITGFPVRSDIKLFIYNPDVSEEETATSPTSDPNVAKAMEQLQKLGGLFGRKKSTPQPTATPKSTSGRTPFMTFHSEIKTIDFSPISEEMFRIPADFRKVEMGNDNGIY